MTFKDHKLQRCGKPELSAEILYWTFSVQCPATAHRRGINSNLVPPQSLLLHHRTERKAASIKAKLSEIKAVSWGGSDHTIAGVQVFEIMLSWVNDGKEQIFFLITLHLTKGFFENIVWEHPSCSKSLHENYLPLRQLIKHSHQLENEISNGAHSEHQTCFLTATCTSELLHSAVNHMYIRILHHCMLRAGFDLHSASPYAPEQAINPSSHLAFSDE